MADTLPPLPDLKPCPFCGSVNLTDLTAGRITPNAFITCSDCRAEGPPLREYKGAETAWNRRAALAAVPAQPEDQAEPLKGWKLNHVQYVRGSGTAEIGYLDPEDDRFAPIVTVDTGLYYQAEQAAPLAIAILGALAAAPQAVPVPDGWVPMHERSPDPDTECVVILRYSLDRPPFTAIDTWAMQREDPTGMGGPTMETGYGWNDNFDSDVIAWMPVLPHPPADWDQRLGMLAAAPKEQP